MTVSTLYADAHEAVSKTLIRLAGVTAALYECAREHDGLNNPEPMSNAILSMIVCLEEKVTTAQARHEAELDAHRKATGTKAAA